MHAGRPAGVGHARPVVLIESRRILQAILVDVENEAFVLGVEPERLKRDGKLTLRILIDGRKSRSEMIGVFLALLELIRQKKILVSQGGDLADMEIETAPPEHRLLANEAAEPVAVTVTVPTAAEEVSPPQTQE